MNVLDKYKDMSVDEIRIDVQRHTFPYSVLMQHIEGDFNISTLIRNSNAFGVREVFYFGRKKWDRRGAVGTHNYTQLTHIDSLDEVLNLKKNGRLIAVENNIEGAVELSTFNPQHGDIFVFGEECSGISENLLKVCDTAVYIKQWGSVRSLNVGTASGILMCSVSSIFDNSNNIQN